MSQDEDVQKLMEIASKPLKVPVKKAEYESSTFQFIAEAKIKSSREYIVPSAVVYLRYHKWCKMNNVKPKGIVSFAIDFSKKFQKQMKFGKANYQVSPEGFDLTEAGLQDAELFLQDVRNGKKKTKKERKS